MNTIRTLTFALVGIASIGSALASVPQQSDRLHPYDGSAAPLNTASAIDHPYDGNAAPFDTADLHPYDGSAAPLNTADLRPYDNNSAPLV